MRPFGTKTHGEKFLYALYFRYDSENFAMIAKFCYHSENTGHGENSNFRYAQ